MPCSQPFSRSFFRFDKVFGLGPRSRQKSLSFGVSSWSCNARPVLANSVSVSPTDSSGSGSRNCGGTAYTLHVDQKVAEQLPTRNGGASRQGNVQRKIEARIQQEIADGSLKKEDFGTQIINGVFAQGVRYTRTIPAGRIGNANPIKIVTERWYSPDLQVVVKTMHSDPMSGRVTYTLNNIQRTEPAASLFTVPPGYTVTPATSKPGRRGNGGPGNGSDVD